jgi:hypothetical protein
VVKELPLCRWTWKEGYGGDDRSKLGWIAQDVQGVYPKSVSVVDDNLTLNSDQLYATMWGAIQKLQSMVEALGVPRALRKSLDASTHGPPTVRV